MNPYLIIKEFWHELTRPLMRPSIYRSKDMKYPNMIIKAENEKTGLVIQQEFDSIYPGNTNLFAKNVKGCFNIYDMRKEGFYVRVTTRLSETDIKTQHFPPIKISSFDEALVIGLFHDPQKIIITKEGKFYSYYPEQGEAMELTETQLRELLLDKLANFLRI